MSDREYNFVSTYKQVERITDKVIHDIGIDNLMPEYDVTSMLLNKVGAYNCSLESIIKHINNNDLYSILYRTPIIRKIVSKIYIKKKEEYEIDIDRLIGKNKKNIIKSDAYYFCSFENYCSVLISHATSNYDLSKVTLILPDEAIEWGLYDKIVQSNINVFHLSYLGLTLNEVKKSLSDIKKLWNKNESKLGALLVRHENDYTKFFLPIIKNFIIEFCAYHFALSIKFDKEISFQGSPVFVARNRRAIENLVSQSARNQNSRITMVLHGVLTSDYDKWQLFTSNYKYLDEVIVFGKQQEDAIVKKQKYLGLSIPKINIQSKYFVKTLLGGEENKTNKTNKTNKIKLLIVGQGFNDKYLHKLSVKLSKQFNKDYEIFFRPVPKNFKKFKSLFIEKRNNLAKYLNEYDIVISHSSTALFEAVIAKSLVLVLNFNTFNQVFSTPLSETRHINKNDRSKMILESDQCLIDVMSNIAKGVDVNVIKTINQKWIKYFVK